MTDAADGLHIFQAAKEIRVMHDYTECLVVQLLFECARVEIPVRSGECGDRYRQVFEVSLKGAAIFRMNTLGHEHFFALPTNTHGHEDAFRYRAATLIKAGIGNIHARELADQRLVFEKGLQTSLAGLGL